jgi:plasmid maintenance system antidote protein VapI
MKKEQEESVNKRVMTYIKSKSLTIKALASYMGVNEKTLGNKLVGRIRIDMDTAMTLLSTFESLSAEWLFRGNGPMELSNKMPDSELEAVCVDQAKEIFRLKQKIAELEGEKKGLA